MNVFTFYLIVLQTYNKHVLTCKIKTGIAFHNLNYLLFLFCFFKMCTLSARPVASTKTNINQYLHNRKQVSYFSINKFMKTRSAYVALPSLVFTQTREISC